MALISTISINVAKKISSFGILDLLQFLEKSTCNEYMLFTHYNFFYSHPEFGKKWINGEEFEFHSVETKCHLCDDMPYRNFAGIGSLYLLNNGITDPEILVYSGTGKQRKAEYQQNKSTRMILLCENHIGSHFAFNPNK